LEEEAVTVACVEGETAGVEVTHVVAERDNEEEPLADALGLSD
jgi:hypothetical protein